MDHRSTYAKSWLPAIAGLVLLEASMSSLGQPVHPKQLQGAAVAQLPDLIAELLPTLGQESIGWNHGDRAPIKWMTTGFARRDINGEIHYLREGVVRVKVGSRVSTVLRQRKEELGWTVTLKTKGPPKFGPTTVTIEPGIPGEVCFGTLYEGCSFPSPASWLAGSSVRYSSLCEAEMGPHNIVALRISTSDSRPVALIWETDGGSGGTSSWVTLEFNEANAIAACKRLSDSSKSEQATPTSGVARSGLGSATQIPLGWTNGTAVSVGVVPGAIVCQDADMVQYMFGQISEYLMEAFADRISGGQTSLVRGAPRRPDLAAHGCALIPAGSSVAIDRRGIVPIVQGVSETGNLVVGVSLPTMIK